MRYHVDAGVVGDYGNAPIIVRKTSSGIITGIQDEYGRYVSAERLTTFMSEDGFIIEVVTAGSTRLLYMDVVSASSLTTPGLNNR